MKILTLKNYLSCDKKNIFLWRTVMQVYALKYFTQRLHCCNACLHMYDNAKVFIIITIVCSIDYKLIGRVFWQIIAQLAHCTFIIICTWLWVCSVSQNRSSMSSSDSLRAAWAICLTRAEGPLPNIGTCSSDAASFCFEYLVSSSSASIWEGRVSASWNSFKWMCVQIIFSYIHTCTTLQKELGTKLHWLLFIRTMYMYKCV